MVRRGLHRSFAESAVQNGAEVAEHGLAADDEDPGIHDGVQGIEAECPQVCVVVGNWPDGVAKTSNLQKQRRWGSGGWGWGGVLEMHRTNIMLTALCSYILGQGL